MENLPHGAYNVVLLALKREPHKAYPKCSARELCYNSGERKSAPQYPWCDRSARFSWGDQYLCPLHAEKLVTTRYVSGITPNGKWGSCRVHIDCNHPIDDGLWESHYRADSR